MTRDRPAKCPRCGSGRTATIIYGRSPADGKVIDELSLHRAVLRKRSPDGNDPRWFCLHCSLEWGHPRGISGSSPGQDDMA